MTEQRPIQITRQGVVCASTPDDRRRMRDRFDREHHLFLPRFFEPALAALFRRRLEIAPFVPCADEGIALRLQIADPVTRNSLDFLLDDRALFAILAEITGCGRLRAFQGRVLRIVPGDGHYDSWHDDINALRVLGLTVNLSNDVYAGGLFQIRERASKTVLHELANTGFGDALLFRLDSAIQHRISEVHGTAPRTSYAGWFAPEAPATAG